MAAFIFISGSEGEPGHWAACQRLLTQRGHRTLALGWGCLPWGEGLPGVLTFLQEEVRRWDRPLLVGHSAGGLLIPRVLHGVRAEIYLAALVPQPGASFAEQMFESPTEVFDPAWLAQAYPPHTREAAILRTLYDTPFTTYPERPRIYHPYLKDRELRPQWQQWAARHLVQAEGHPLPGGHYTHTTHPEAVCEALQTVASL